MDVDLTGELIHLLFFFNCWHLFMPLKVIYLFSTQRQQTITQLEIQNKGICQSPSKRDLRSK